MAENILEYAQKMAENARAGLVIERKRLQEILAERQRKQPAEPSQQSRWPVSSFHSDRDVFSQRARRRNWITVRAHAFQVKLNRPADELLHFVQRFARSAQARQVGSVCAPPCV